MIVIALMVAACGGGDDATSEPTRAAESPAAEETVEAPTEAPPTDGTDSTSATFEDTVRAARDAARAEIDEAEQKIGDDTVELSPEQSLMGPVADGIATIAAVMTDYTELLESLDAPPELAAEIERHVAELRATITRQEAATAAASAGDDARLTELSDEVALQTANLVAALDPSYAEFAFLSPFGSDQGDFSEFSELDEAEIAYLEGVRSAQNEFDERNANFGRAIQRTYVNDEALLRALYEAGAGEAFAAVQTVALELDPPERFADDHARWLLLLEEQVRLDRLIGEAARDGDRVGFETNNIRLGLLGFPEATEVDPAFGAALKPGSPVGRSLELDEGVPEEPYLFDLFDILFVHQLKNPGSLFFAASDDPGAPAPVAAIIAATGDEVVAAQVATIDAVATLTPPDAYVTDHERILRFFDEELALMEEVVVIAKAEGEGGDSAATRQALDANSGPESPYCGVVSELSDEIRPATDVFFDADAPFCKS